MHGALAATPAGTAAAEFAQDVRRDLARTPKVLQPRYFYDALGSALFDAITRLPWYRITRAESALLVRHAEEIAERLRDPVGLVELGGGSGEKLAFLVEALVARGRPARVHLVDVSEAALAAATERLSRFPGIRVTAHRATYEAGLESAAAAREAGESRLVLFLGSNLGNSDPAGAAHLLAQVRAGLRPGDGLLLGADLVKPKAELVLAYDDPLGVTAAFNKNVLARINAELGGDFDLAAFDHRAVWNAERARVEMHLVARRAQTVHIAQAGAVVSLAAGESIWTESSYKFEPEGLRRLGSRAGFRRRALWVEGGARFALALFEARAGARLRSVPPPGPAANLSDKPTALPPD